MRQRLLASSMICGAFAAFAATSAYAQSEEVQEVVVTGSRIARQDFVAASPIATVTGEQATANADVTLDTYLNTLPQVNPAGTTSSNNPSNNGGQSNINLRGLGANRNLVLVDGRRPMVSNNNLTVDLNTIPQALIQSIEVITGGAGATYGADAVAGVVNLKLRRNFEGIDLRASYSNSTEFWDAEEYQFSTAIGGNFADGRGNAVFGFDRSVRQPISKGQREFAAFATSTTGTPPEGAVRWGSTNPIPLAAIQALFGQASYGSVAAGAISSSSGTLGINLDDSLIYYGLANDPARQVANYKYPVDVSVNKRFFPDFYSYNFDAPNLLILPLDRYSFLFNTNYELENGIEFFAQAGWTEYNAATALAPSPLPTVNTRAIGEATARDVASALVTPGRVISPQSFIVPVTNPFIPADLRTLLAARTGDDPTIVGSGATEPFLFGFRPVAIGPRLAYNQNTVVQFMGGVKAPISDNWRFEGYVSRGTTEVDLTQIGNIDTQRLQAIFESPTQNPAGSNGACANQNFFGDRPVSSLCANYILSNGAARTSFEQTIGQAYVAGPVMTLPAGDLEAVLGAEYRGFDYTFRFLSNPGPFSGFNTQDPEAGTTSSRDVFGELLVPIVKDLPYANTVELGLGARYSESEFMNKLNGTGRSARGSWSYKAELTWEPMDYARVRASYQRAVREPNFNELFAGGGSAPQIFDPCNSYTKAWTASTATGAGTLRGLCIDGRGVSPTTGATTSPGAQANLQIEGNANLDAEKANTWTLGVVLSSPWENQWLERLRGTVDYYNIEVADPILPPDPSVVIAACYNYFGTNPTYDRNYKYCRALPSSAPTLSGATIRNPADQLNGRFPNANGGLLKTSGLDIQIDYGFEWEWFGLPEWMGSLQANALFTHVMNFSQADAEDLPEVDYTGTISYFGAGLGTSFPEWKANFNTRWKLGENPYGDFDVGVRARYIGSMTNRTLAQFKGETFLGTAGVPTDVKATWYFDADAGWGITDNVEVRIGVNNIANLQPRQYAPNVQSGTDPSTYDVVGRRLFASIKLRF